MKYLAGFHAGKHCFFYKTASLFLLFVPAFVHGKHFHFLFFHFSMIAILHMQPYTIHFFKQYRNDFFTLHPVCVHFFYGILFFFSNPFSQSLHHIPDATATDGLSACIADGFCRYTIRCLCYSHCYLFCKIG